LALRTPIQSIGFGVSTGWWSAVARTEEESPPAIVGMRMSPTLSENQPGFKYEILHVPASRLSL
jgi:hypothetical protein